MRNYGHHHPDPDEPWWSVGIVPADRVRYNRALRLSQFRRQVAHGPSVMMDAERIAYRQECLERWHEYLDGWAPPKPIGDNGRPPKAIEDRKAWKGKVAIRISVETAALAQRLMLRFPEQPNVESLFEYALRKLADDSAA